MGAISSEIVHLLKVKLSLQNDQRWLLLVSWLKKRENARQASHFITFPQLI